MEEDKIEVLHKRDVPGGDDRWPISVQVERRTTSRDGKSKTYINLLVAVGQKKLFIPRRASKDVASALAELAEVANSEYTALLEETNSPRRYRRHGGNHG